MHFNPKDISNQIIFYGYQGFSSKEVAKSLHLSRRAADNKLEGIDEKMGVHHHEEFKKYIERMEYSGTKQDD